MFRCSGGLESRDPFSFVPPLLSPGSIVSRLVFVFVFVWVEDRVLEDFSEVQFAYPLLGYCSWLVITEGIRVIWALEGTDETVSNLKTATIS